MFNNIYKAERAVIMAAGVGNRLHPLTLKTPKPLIKVNGVRMIDSVVRALHANGITEIYVVVGYLKGQFEEWVKQYEGITLIENPYYETCNNITSLYVARDHICDCIILDGDQIIRNDAALNPHFTLSGYNAVWREGYTNEWLLQLDNDVIKSCSREGGNHGWQLYSVSRWNAEDGGKLKLFLEEEFAKGNTQIYWDDVPMFAHFDSFTLGIKEMNDGDVVEVDSIDELLALDDEYKSIIQGEE